MLLRSALKPPASCSTQFLGLSFSRTSTRTFTTSPSSLLSRRLPHQFPRSHVQTRQTRTAALSPSRHPLLLTATALSLPTIYLTTPATYNDSSPAAADFSNSAYTHSRDAKVPITKDGRSLNPAAIKQISFGSLVGLGLGVLVSAFSRMLVLVVGVGVVVAQVS